MRSSKIAINSCPTVSFFQFHFHHFASPSTSFRPHLCRLSLHQRWIHPPFQLCLCPSPTNRLRNDTTMWKTTPKSENSWRFIVTIYQWYNESLGYGKKYILSLDSYRFVMFRWYQHPFDNVSRIIFSWFHDQHEDIRASFIWMIPPTSCIKSEFLSCSSEFHRNLPKNNPQTTLKSPIFNLEAISEAHVHLFSMDFPCQSHGKTWKTWAPTPRVACFPGSPVAGLCTEEAVTTTRAVGDKLGSILGMLGCGVCCWWFLMLGMKIFDDLADLSVEMALNGMNHVEVVDNMLLYIMVS